MSQDPPRLVAACTLGWLSWEARAGGDKGLNWLAINRLGALTLNRLGAQRSHHTMGPKAQTNQPPQRQRGAHGRVGPGADTPSLWLSSLSVLKWAPLWLWRPLALGPLRAPHTTKHANCHGPLRPTGSTTVGTRALKGPHQPSPTEGRPRRPSNSQLAHHHHTGP